MSQPLTTRVPATAAGQPLLAWLAGRFRYHGTAGWRQQLESGRLQRNGVVARGDECLATGDRVTFTPAAPAADESVTTVPVLHVDDDLLVVDKPPYTVVQQESAFPRHAFVAALAARFPPAADTTRLEPVHRLDRETSGVLVLARSRLAARAMQGQFEAHTVQKCYVAVVHGVVAADELVLDGAIGPARSSTVAARRAVVAAGTAGARTAHTELRVLERLRGATLVELRPHTGRTHQLRVHLEQLGHPLVGDKLYGHDDARHWRYLDHLKRDGDPRWPEECAVGRQLLHALRLTCTHPRSGTPLTFAAPWPPDLAAFVRARGGTVPTSA